MLSLPEYGLYFSFLLFLIGLFGVMFRKNIIFMMLGVELILNAANLAFVSASKLTNTIDGVAACEAAIGLAMIISLYRAKSTIEIDDLKLLRG
jgi:NADH:ubiquinone oxidoreductase subunit K